MSDLAGPAGHLTPGRAEVLRFPAPAALAGRVRWAWAPRWDLPAGERIEQHMIEYPGGNLVVEPHGTAYHHPEPALATQVLEGAGWAVGLLLEPGIGRQFFAAGGRVADVGAAGAGTLDAEAAGGGVAPGPLRALSVAARNALAELTSSITDTMSHLPATGPFAEAAEKSAAAFFTWAESWLPPLDVEGELLNSVVTAVENDEAITSTSLLAEATGIPPRRLQRVVSTGLGYSPTWLIRRRRLQDGAAHIRAGRATAAEIAAVLGYADQAHFSRDFKAVTGFTPREYAKQTATP